MRNDPVRPISGKVSECLMLPERLQSGRYVLEPAILPTSLSHKHINIPPGKATDLTFYKMRLSKNRTHSKK